MLKELYIENLAIIEKAVIGFDDRFNVFTGETGAGKSILIGGINAVTGGRTHKDIVRRGADKGIVTALFTDIPNTLREKLMDLGYPLSPDLDEIVLTREINADGKSTARINGRTAPSGVLREISADLLDIHGQHDSRILTNPDNHRELLDNFGGYHNILSEYKECFRSFSAVSRQIRLLEAEESQKDFKLKMLEDKIQEIEDLNLLPGDDQATAAALIESRNKERIRTGLNKVFNAISGDEENGGVLNLLTSSIMSLKEITEFNPLCGELSLRIENSLTELTDIKSEVLHLIPDEYGGAELSSLEEKMSAITALKRKYKMELDEILGEYKNWKEEQNSLLNHDDELENLRREKKSLGEQVKTLGLKITEKRKAAAETISKSVTGELIYLDMPDVNLDFKITQDKVTVNGMDSVEIYISVNKGEPPKPISKIASGGELSRIMLAIKSCFAETDDIPTMIFDEIDTGISGRAAGKVGTKMADLSKNRQVLCVTHLAQIASKATNHLLIEKETNDGRTFTRVKPLSLDGRKRELARIISGEPDNQSALIAAEELLR